MSDNDLQEFTDGRDEMDVNSDDGEEEFITPNKVSLLTVCQTAIQ